ncbi:hypothetical protein [Rossellomorea vietnamensis]|uniref:hypothetical protein n=1 Tax=Rossellomorea vietnamensis TaxID=218284 RepID=UPI00077C9030|nr:hypothetical protein [Rossellomorea vietnamensis]
MLQKRIQQYIDEMKGSDIPVHLFKQERDYVLNHGLLDADEVAAPEAGSRFQDAYIERCEKETEELIKEETDDFLNQHIIYLKKHKNEFIYLESKWFALIGVDAVSVEVDDVFGTYDVMLGLKLQKKYRGQIESYLDGSLKGESSYDLLFNGEDGLWDLNFNLNDHGDFDESQTMLTVYELIYDILFNLLQTVEES